MGEVLSSFLSFLAYTPLKEWIAWNLPYLFRDDRHISAMHQGVLRELTERAAIQ